MHFDRSETEPPERWPQENVHEVFIPADDLGQSQSARAACRRRRIRDRRGFARGRRGIGRRTGVAGAAGTGSADPASGTLWSACVRGETCTATVAAEDAEGNRIEAPAPLSFTAPPLPDEFPPFEVTACVPEKREPGAMLFNIRHSPASEHLPGSRDRRGRPRGRGRLVLPDRRGGRDVRRLANGNILYVADGGYAKSTCWATPSREWYAETAGRTGPRPPAPFRWRPACSTTP